MSPEDVNALPVTAPTLVEAYGPDKVQVGELRVPTGKGPFPVAIIIHGGCWTKGFAQMRNTSALADALTKDGVATWNVDYRQIGEPGAGWPGTFQDWGSAADHLRSLGARYPLDLKRVIAVGHSAGAPAALWLAAREKLPLSSPIRGEHPIKIRAAVAIDGPGDLAPFHRGGRPNLREAGHRSPSLAQRRRLSLPAISRPVLTLSFPSACRSTSCPPPPCCRRTPQKPTAAAAVRAGDTVLVLSPKKGGHFDIIAPQTPAGMDVKNFVERAVPAR